MAEVVHMAAPSGPSAIKISILTLYFMINGDLLTQCICYYALTVFPPFLLFPTSSHASTVAACCTKSTVPPLMEISSLTASLGPLTPFKHFALLAHAVSPSQCSTHKWWDLQHEVFSGYLLFTVGTRESLGVFIPVRNMDVWDIFIPAWNSKYQWTGLTWLTSIHKSSANIRQ